MTSSSSPGPSPEISTVTTPAPGDKTPISQDDLYEFFKAQNIGYKTVEHEPVFTVEESSKIKADMVGGHTKNLFLKDKTGRMFLICAQSDTLIKVNKLHSILGCKRLSFGKPDRLLQYLGVTPGSVTLFAILNDVSQAVTLIIDKRLTRHDIVNFHPLKNEATTAISTQDMLKFTKATGHDPQIIDFAALAGPE